MKIKFIFCVVLLLFGSNTSFGQTSSEIEKNFGKPTNAYSVSDHIWLTPEYDADGQICRATLYYKRISAEANYVSNSYLPVREVLKVFNDLAPLDKRGARKEYFGNTQTSASMAWTTFEYEKVTFSLWISFKFGSVADMAEKGVPLGGRTPAETNEPDDEFMAKNTVNPELVYITWNGRKCVKK
jgi:hypothetical protein